jgi:HAMP domain-containing protein
MRVAALTRQASELSDATRSIILARVEATLKSNSRSKPSRVTAPTRKDSATTDPSGGTPATAERLDQLEQTLAAMRQTSATIVHLSRRAGRYLVDRKET